MAADAAEIAAVSSRRMETARAFADKHSVATAFDSWQEMCEWDGVDAIYVATPTSVREEICLAAAANGKHVLGEKPFATLPSVQRITAACRENNVAFMDGTHFVHHPRTRLIRRTATERTGWPWSVASAFQFGLGNRENIRFKPDLEPMGAIGDAGWYNMRAAVEYLSPGIKLASTHATARIDKESGAVISGSGVMLFDDGSTSTWNCGFDSGAVVMDLRITGESGVISIGDFLSQNPDGSADFVHSKGGWGSGTADTVNVASDEARIRAHVRGLRGRGRRSFAARPVDAGDRGDPGVAGRKLGGRTRLVGQYPEAAAALYYAPENNQVAEQQRGSLRHGSRPTGHIDTSQR